MARERGFALLIVLWTLGLLALLGSHLAAAARGATELSTGLRAAAMAEAAGDGLVQEAIFHLVDQGKQRWAADGATRTVLLARGSAEIRTLGSAEIRIEDHAGRINPNAASAAILTALLGRVGVEEAAAGRLAAAIVDWRSPGVQPSPGGAKLPQYRAEGLPYGPPRGNFKSRGELSLVLGMTPEILRAVSPYLSIHAPTKVDLARAGPVVAQVVLSVGEDPQALQLRAPVGNDPTAPMIVDISVVVVMPGARFSRVTTLRIDVANEDTARPWQVLEWE